MKKAILLTLLISLVFATESWGQVEHMKFMGIPIDGKINNFGKELMKKGFTYIGTTSSSKAYKGVFAGDIANVYALFDNSSKKVFAVGVNIECYSESIARDIYWKYVRNLKEKYNAQKYEDIMDLYKENPEDLYPDIINGKFKGFNSIMTDSIQNSTRIDISKVVLNDSDSLVLNSPLRVGMAYLSFKYTGNVGTIIVQYEKNEVSYGYGDYYKVSILYRDEQNALEEYKNRQDDL